MDYYQAWSVRRHLSDSVPLAVKSESGLSWGFIDYFKKGVGK
jgi:hypothetical protein